MYEIGEYVVYKRDLCKVKKILEKYHQNTDYYVLESCSDSSLTISIPSNSTLIRKLITKEELEELIKRIPSIPVVDSSNKMIENIYKELLSSNSYDDLIKIIKTTYLRNKSRIDNNKKVAEKDIYYFEKAEKLLYNEFSVVLNMNYNDTKEYIRKKIEELVD